MLIVIRGNSGAGKSSVARAVRDRYGRGCALIEQDYLRRIVLREHDSPDPSAGIAPRFITHAAGYALDHGYHVILEGILPAPRYGPALRELVAAHSGPSHAFYLDASFAETVRRHGTRPQANEFTPAQMRSWYAEADHLGLAGETVIDQASTLDETVDRILDQTGLLNLPATADCPTRCEVCQAE